MYRPAWKTCGLTWNSTIKFLLSLGIVVRVVCFLNILVSGYSRISPSVVCFWRAVWEKETQVGFLSLTFQVFPIVSRGNSLQYLAYEISHFSEFLAYTHEISDFLEGFPKISKNDLPLALYRSGQWIRFLKCPILNIRNGYIQNNPRKTSE